MGLAISRTEDVSLNSVALIAGVGLLVMFFCAVFAEMYAYPRLVAAEKPAETFQLLVSQKGLFKATILGYLLIFICDVLVAWALYIFFAPVSKSLSLLTAWFRLIYTAIALFALAQLVTVFKLLNSAEFMAAFEAEQLHMNVWFALSEFRHGWSLGFFFFSIHLGMLAYLAYRSGYVPKVVAILLAVAGTGYFIECMKPYLYPDLNTGWIMITFFGESVFMLWLLIKGRKLRE